MDENRHGSRRTGTKKNPWYYAAKAGREYITPEDVGDAYSAGAERPAVSLIVLHAIANKQVEDVSCTAFCAVRPPRKPRSNVPT